MKISSIIDIVDGELQNSPSISFIYNIKINVKKIIEGDLFIARNKKDIEEAVKSGAFAIIYDFDYIEILDCEIAWIKVTSTKDALIKLFRFKLSHLDLDVFYCDKISYDLLNIFKNLNKNIKFISDKIENSISIIENIKTTEIIFCSDMKLLNTIYPKYKIFNNQTYKIENLISHSLFETSFSNNGLFFSRLKIPGLYINQFLDVFYFLDNKLETKKLIKLQHFKPIFIDKLINEIEFGHSNKFLLVQKDFDLIDNEIKYLKSKYKYGRTIFISSKYVPNLNEEQIVLTKIKEIKEFLLKENFNAAYIIGYDKSKIERFLNLSSLKKANLF